MSAQLHEPPREWCTSAAPPAELHILAEAHAVDVVEVDVNALGILVHADVVPAGDVARWTHPPFGGELIDGAVWGRGSLDDKGPLVASLYAMAALKDADRKSVV